MLALPRDDEQGKQSDGVRALSLTVTNDRFVNFDGSTAPLNHIQVESLRQSCACYACKNSHFVGAFLVGYLWLAIPSDNQFHPDSWLIQAITECGAPANTEYVASFVGRYHNAEANAKQVCEDHNRWVLKRAGALAYFLAQPSQNLSAKEIIARLESANASKPLTEKTEEGSAKS